MTLKFRTVEKQGKKVKEYLRICKYCGDKEWKIHNPTRTATMCKDCSKIFTSQNNAPISNEKAMPQDEDKNNAMIAKFLKKNKPSVKFKEDVEFKAYIPKERTTLVEKKIDSTESLEVNLVGFDSVDDYYDYNEALKFLKKLKAVA